MQELSISRAIADVAVRHARSRPVGTVRVRLGALRRVTPEGLAFSWDLARRRPLLEEAALQVERVPGVVHCTSCDRRSPVSGVALRCPACGDGIVRVVQGEECLVTAIDLA